MPGSFVARRCRQRLVMDVIQRHCCRMVPVGGMAGAHHMHAEDPGDDGQEPCDQGALQERPGKTRRM